MKDQARFDDEMDADLERLAARSQTPVLPPRLVELPWTVQERRRFNLLPGGRPSLSGMGRASLALARIGATLAFVVAIAYGVAFVRTSTPGAAHGNVPLDIFTPAAAATPAPEVVIVNATGNMEVDASMVTLVQSGITRAVNDHAAAVIIELDTPGGFSDSMTQITTSLLEAQVPTVVWVSPAGARAASAGTFITLAAHIDLMAPATHIGAASPVDQNGNDIGGTLGQKIMEDARAQIRSIAQQRHPKAVDWADSTVAQAKSYTVDDAIAAGAVDGKADTLDAVLAFIDGKTVTISGHGGSGAQQVTIGVRNANRVQVGESVFDQLLGLLRDPNIAFVLLVLGMLAVLFEFFHPTLLVGLTGTLALVLAFYGIGSLPVNVLGLTLVVLGIAMLILEPNVPSHGLLSVGGLICFILGAVYFYGSPGPYVPEASVALPIVVTMAALAAAYALILVRTLMSLRRAVPVTGSGMVGTQRLQGAFGEVRMELRPEGTVYVDGESWSARTRDESTVPEGARVRVVDQQGLTLVVEPVPEAEGMQGA